MTTGSYPKICDDPAQPNLRRTLHRFDRGEATQMDVDAAIRRTIARVVREQRDAGIDVITDGQIRWQDLVSPLAGGLRGVELGGLLRYFDNNVYYRRAICRPPMTWRSPQTLDDWEYASSIADRPVKAVLPGPLSAAALSVDETFADPREFALRWADVIHSEALALEEAGATVIQFDEPQLATHPDQVALAREALNVAVEGLKCTTVLALYFGDVSPMWDELQTFPITILHVDVVSMPVARSTVLSKGAKKGLSYGVVDARNTRLESADSVVSDLAILAGKVDGDLFVAPSCGLEFLPHDRALRKIELLGRIASRAREEGL